MLESNKDLDDASGVVDDGCWCASWGMGGVGVWVASVVAAWVVE